MSSVVFKKEKESVQLERDEINCDLYKKYELLKTVCAQNDIKTARDILESLGPHASSVVNTTPNTLLFKACEEGHLDMASLLIEFNAIGYLHPVTKHSPLYIACYAGRTEIVRKLLYHFPELVSESTVEGWLPIHAAVSNNHLNIVYLLLNFDYPSKIMTTFYDKKRNYEYEFAFNLNAQDINGQTILYIASLLGNLEMVEMLLKFQVKGRSIVTDSEDYNQSSRAPTAVNCKVSPKRVSSGIVNIINRLSSTDKNETSEKESSNSSLFLGPFNLDVYCNNSETALHVAVRNKHYSTASLLLSNGADPNLPIHPKGHNCANKNASTALAEACKLGDSSMVDLLIRFGARDEKNQALKVASSNNDPVLISKLLSLRSFVDREYKINKKSVEFSGVISGLMGTVTFSSMFPTTPVMVNWYSLNYLNTIKAQWLINASIVHNIKLKLSPQNQYTALHAITRLDLSNNHLKTLPFCIFKLPSLRILNLGQNCLSSLPEVDTEVQENCKIKKSRSFTSNMNLITSGTWSLPLLEELILQDNGLESLPSCLFDLPSLSSLNLSNNKLTSLPNRIWFGPKLRELNLSYNLLRNLPHHSNISNLKNSKMEEVKSKSQKFLKDCHSDEKEFKSMKNFEQQHLRHINIWSSQLEIVAPYDSLDFNDQVEQCKLTLLDLSHNAFEKVPEVLSCIATNLVKLDLSYNQLKAVGSIKCFPANLKHLDLSHNYIVSWFIHSNESLDQTICYYPHDSKQSLKSKNKYCIHKQHNRLDSLKKLIISHNLLPNILVTCDEQLMIDDFESIDVLDKSMRSQKAIFPSLSLLDISYNRIDHIPSNISELTNLSVFNISGNPNVQTLPSEMGLLSLLWNLSTTGCNLHEPLKTMIESKKYKTIDIIGYLKSILEDAKPYARMKLMVVGVQGIGKTSLLEQLRQEGTGSYRKKAPEHWAKRMGNKNISLKTPKGVTLSTVGVDVCDWTYEKKVRGQPSFGPVTFRTWDFGGQREYYATHQYFLSKRSLYLVLWKMIDGEKAVEGIQQWLVNIQARAPNASVIIVGTHFDLVPDNFTRCYASDLQQMIRDKFINVIDADKCGLPRVVDSIEISVKTKHNIKTLCNLIYDTVFDLRSPGSKERLLEQKIPATYLALEDVVSYLAFKRREAGLDPVLKSEQYKVTVLVEMSQKFGFTFRDAAELHQATTFLHENGVLLHYEDATLKDLYFLDPQWLCDLLAHVVTIREINPYAKNGIMKTDDLKHLFKSSSFAQSDAKYYIISLLNKFEVALTWDTRTLLIPSLLPTEDAIQSGVVECDVRIPVRSRGWALRSRLTSIHSSTENESNNSEEPTISSSIVDRSEKSIFRLILMTYFPSGFWPRLMTRVLADDNIIEIVRSFFHYPKDAESDALLLNLFNCKAEWVCWQTGFALKYLNTVIFRVKEVLNNIDKSTFDYYSSNFSFMVKQETKWYDIEINKSSILEIYAPNSAVHVITKNPGVPINSYMIEPSSEYLSKLLALTVDHIDTLLEDWYPSLGTRFVHTSEGKFLVTRLVPCVKCLSDSSKNKTYEEEDQDKHVNSTSSSVSRDSGLDESCLSSQNGSIDSYKNISKREVRDKKEKIIYCFMVEECILRAYEQKVLSCPTHDSINLCTSAPDTVFVDLGEVYSIKPENIKRGKLLGRGAFGFVFRASVKQKGSNAFIDVALKMLQPIDPGYGSSKSDQKMFKVALNKWERDPMRCACKAYCTARQELNILLTLRHPNIVPLVGVSTYPLALVLRLAPLGALDTLIKDYRRSGIQIDCFVIQKIVLQIAKALEYLHQQRIIYRDLKSENVLVWKLPLPHTNPETEVSVKLADYGISRSTLPAGAKGFGGTEGFMAPEIMRYNGEEEYTEKVDCFSFGMFMYELITLRQPFEGQTYIKDNILEGGRPSLTERDINFPPHLLDLMVLCWSQLPENRPATSQIVSITGAPEFVHLLDVIHLADRHEPLTSELISYSKDGFCEICVSRFLQGVDWFLCKDGRWVDYRTIQTLKQIITSICCVESMIWFGDATGHIYIHSLSDYSFVDSLKPDENDDSAIKCLSYVHTNCVAILNISGRLWICNTDNMTLREIGNNGLVIHCFEKVTRKKNTIELWCGQSKANMSIYTIEKMIISSQNTVNHFEYDVSERLDVFQIVGEENFMWTYLYPGSIVYQWSIEKRSLMHKLDCSKLLPCSESLLSISIEESLMPENCQITSMDVVDDQLLLGTTWGCLFIVEGSTMRPVTVFRPYEDEIKTIIAFKTAKESDEIEDGNINKSGGKRIITIGKKYRSLMNRFVGEMNEKSDEYSQSGFYAILWNSTNWNT